MNNSIATSIKQIQSELQSKNVELIAVSKTKPNEIIMEAYETGQRAFGENKVQDLVAKYESLPKDINWHMIGHLQRNKVKYIAPFVHLIHGVDSESLLRTINKEGKKNNRTISCLLQIHIAQEETKFGFDGDEIENLLNQNILDALEFIEIQGLMGMASHTEDNTIVANEFKGLHDFFESIASKYQHPRLHFDKLSMGMSGDYRVAIENGSTMVRIGSTIFGSRK